MKISLKTTTTLPNFYDTMEYISVETIIRVNIPSADYGKQ